MSSARASTGAAPETLGAVPCAPVLITQVNSETALGIPPRRFRELLRELRLPVIQIGKLRAIEPRVLLEALRTLATQPTDTETEREELRRIVGLK